MWNLNWTMGWKVWIVQEVDSEAKTLSLPSIWCPFEHRTDTSGLPGMQQCRLQDKDS